LQLARFFPALRRLFSQNGNQERRLFYLLLDAAASSEGIFRLFQYLELTTFPQPEPESAKAATSGPFAPKLSARD